MSENKIKVRIEGDDQLTPATKSAVGSIGKLAAGIAVATGAMELASAAASAMVGFLSDSNKAAMQFETTMANVSTIISGDATESINQLSKEIINLSLVTPKSADELGASAYDIMSAGITDAAKAMQTLEAATKLGVAGLGTTGEATDIMTSAINAFSIDASKSAEVADTLFKAVNYGKTTIAQLSQGFSRAAVPAKTLGVRLEEVSAATAALTLGGDNASEAYTKQAALFGELTKPSADLEKAMRKVGITSASTAIKEKGLNFVLQQLLKSADGSSESLIRMFGSKEAGTAAVSLATTQSSAYNEVLGQMIGTVDTLGEAYDKQLATGANQAALATNAQTAAMIALGKEMQPVNDIMNTFKTEFFTAFLEQMPAITAAFNNELLPALANLFGITITDGATAAETVGQLGRALASYVVPAVRGVAQAIEILNMLWQPTIQSMKLIWSIAQQLAGAFMAIADAVGSATEAMGLFSSKSGAPKEMNFPKKAQGSLYTGAGTFLAGEMGGGGELVTLPQGSKITPASETNKMGGGGSTINIVINGSGNPESVAQMVINRLAALNLNTQLGINQMM